MITRDLCHPFGMYKPFFLSSQFTLTKGAAVNHLITLLYPSLTVYRGCQRFSLGHKEGGNGQGVLYCGEGQGGTPPSKNGHTSPLIPGTHAWPPVYMLYIAYRLSSSFVPAIPFYGRGRISGTQGPNAVRHLGKICSRNPVVVFTVPAKNSLFGAPSSTAGSPENVIFNTRSG